MAKKILFENIYLYSCSKGKLKEYEGYIVETDYGSITSAMFRAYDKYDRDINFYKCSSIEGEVCGINVWLSESDIHKAAEIFIKHKEQYINKLKHEISKYEMSIHELEKY